jgi:hypothetical protein
LLTRNIAKLTRKPLAKIENEERKKNKLQIKEAFSILYHLIHSLSKDM